MRKHWTCGSKMGFASLLYLCLWDPLWVFCYHENQGTNIAVMNIIKEEERKALQWASESLCQRLPKYIYLFHASSVFWEIFPQPDLNLKHGSTLDKLCDHGQVTSTLFVFLSLQNRDNNILPTSELLWEFKELICVKHLVPSKESN